MTLRRFTLARLLFAASCLCAPPALADNLSGQASIIDGDTLEIKGRAFAFGHRCAGEQSALPWR